MNSFPSLNYLVHQSKRIKRPNNTIESFAVNREIKKILFIINKRAGVDYQSKLEKDILVACERNGVAGSAEFTKSRGHATQLAAQAASSGFHEVIAVGGDGTSNEVAQGLLHTGIPMGIIPRGSGNGLARHLGIPLNTAEAIAEIFSYNAISMDVFKVNGKLSLNVSGIGFDGHITNLFGVKSTRGLLGYVYLTVKEFLRFREFSAEINASGKRYSREAFIIAIANSSQYGNNARIAPDASVCDGLLNVNIMSKVPFYRLDFVYSFFAGTISQSSFCEVIKTSSLQIKTAEPVAYHIDGEPCGTHHSFAIEVIPAALKILIPDPAKRGYIV